MRPDQTTRDPDVLTRVSLPLIALLVGVALFQSVRAGDWTSTVLLGIGAFHQMYRQVQAKLDRPVGICQY